MPNRILREGILTSERVNELSWPAEVFYRRLMSAVDDFGRFWGKPDLLRAALYPLRLDKVGNPDVVKWIGETREAGLVRTYTVDGKEYLQLLDFRQQVRAAKSKFPEPTSECIATATQTHSRRTAHAPVVGDGDGIEDGDETTARQAEPAGFPEFWKAYPKRAGNNPRARALKAYRARLAEGHAAAEMLDGAARYSRYCQETGKVGTEYVLQAATFLGPDKPFTQTWDGPAAVGTPDYSELTRRLIEKENSDAGV